jgi:malonyl-CoA decarboxylase
MLASLFTSRRSQIRRNDKRSLVELAEDLLTGRGEASGTQTAQSLLEKFADADDAGKLAFFIELAERFDIDTGELSRLTNAYANNRNADNLTALIAKAEPRRQELLRRLNLAPGGTERLVRMREDLLRVLKDNPELTRIDVDFEHLFSSWFNRGFLVLRHIDWSTPADILEKIIRYEAVHAINDWDDLRRRLQPSDRRCFAFFHPAMPSEPLIFVEVALMKGIPGSIQKLLAEARAPVDPGDADTAVFYSISNCQKGLRGVSFGNFLIKQVATDLARDFANIKTFVTLSPIPGFTAWLKKSAEDHPDSRLAEIAHQLNEAGDDAQAILDSLPETDLRTLAGHYFMAERRRDGLPLDPVARFHLGNGASLKNIHVKGDVSAKGVQQSAGMMVNYLYDLDRIEQNHEAYVRENKVTATREVRNLPDAAPLMQPKRKAANG